ncbi:alpha/beta hydrolase [Dyella sp. 2RAB6]|uniref:alpha/beta hydrolase n=1 Tax=Dyella sp. 2RAB6 TaxID=3232992 RepID=UPI003F8E76DA
MSLPGARRAVVSFFVRLAVMSRHTSLLARERIPQPRDQGLEWIDDPRFAFPFLLRKGGYGYVASLLVLLHEGGECETQFAAVAERIADGVAVVMPRACVPLRRGAFAWDLAALEASDGPAMSPAFRSSLEGMLGFVGMLQAWLGVDAARTAVAGFGQGGLLAASMALDAARPAHGLGLLGGRLPLAGEVLAMDAQHDHLHAFVGHGVLDEQMPLQHAEHTAVQLARHGSACRQRRYLAKHELTPQMRNDFVAWFNTSWLDRTVLASPLKGDTRFWG